MTSSAALLALLLAQPAYWLESTRPTPRTDHARPQTAEH